MDPTHPIPCLELYQKAFQKLSSAGISNAANEALWILEQTIGLTRLVIHTHPDEPISVENQKVTWDFVERRALGEPIQYLLGTQEFRGLEIAVHPGVLIPRPESELLVDEVLSHIHGWSKPIVVDVGTGSGCLAVALAVENRTIKILATDRCAPAVNTAKTNAMRHQVASRMKFLVGDLLAPLLSEGLAGKVAAIVANLPYVTHEEWAQLSREVRDFEPRLALDGGQDGLRLHRKLLQEAHWILESHGLLVLEVGSGQAARLCQEVASQGQYSVKNVKRDALGIERVVCLGRKA